MIDQYNAEIDDTKYRYQNSFVLINKLGITSAEAFELAERDIVGFNMLDIRYMNPVPGSFDLKHLKDIHKHLFYDIFSWAGETRTVNIGKTLPFTSWLFIDDYAEDIFTKLKKEKYLIETPAQEYVKRMAHYFGEVNALHPFREGNGRTQKVFFEYLASVSGHRLFFKRISKQEMDDASAASLAGNNDYLESLFQRIIETNSKKMQEMWIRKIIRK